VSTQGRGNPSIPVEREQDVTLGRRSVTATRCYGDIVTGI